MRIITKPPYTEIPPLCERDIKRNLIIAQIYRYNGDINEIVFAVGIGNTFNWYGGHVYEPGSMWGHEYQGHLIDFLEKSWQYWRDVPQMYICESMDDVIYACATIGVTNTKLREKIYDQFNKLRQE